MFGKILQRTAAQPTAHYVRHRLFSSMPKPYAWESRQLVTKSSILAVQSDLAGTIIQPYCRPPLVALDRVFRQCGVVLTTEQLTGPMGKSKPEHIHELVKELNLKVNEKEVVLAFEAELDNIIGDDTELTPFASEFIQFTQQHGIKFAGTTGYFKKAADKAVKELNGLHSLDALIAADEIPNSTRSKLLIANMIKLGYLPENMHQVAFFTDAQSDAISVRTPTNPLHTPFIIGVADCSTHNNIVSKSEEQKISLAELLKRREHTTSLLYKGGAHLVIPNLSFGPLALVSICRAISKGFLPANLERIELCNPVDETPESPQQTSCRR